MNYQLVAGSLNAKLGKGKQLKICVAGHIPIYFLVALVVPFQVNNDRPGRCTSLGHQPPRFVGNLGQSSTGNPSAKTKTSSRN